MKPSAVHAGDIVFHPEKPVAGVIVRKRKDVARVNFRGIPFPKKWNDMTRNDLREWRDANLENCQYIDIGSLRSPAMT